MAGGRMWCLAGGVCIIAGGLCLANSAAHGGALSPSDQPWGLLAAYRAPTSLICRPREPFRLSTSFAWEYLSRLTVPRKIKTAPPTSISNFYSAASARTIKVHSGIICCGRVCISAGQSAPTAARASHIAASRGMSSSRSDFLSKAPLAALFTMVATRSSAAKLLRNGTLKTYKDFPHGMPTTEAETINTDLLAFLKA
jgi:hypothetical protein